MKNKSTRNLAIFTTAFAMAVVILGAFTRLTDSGLGCPDWPGCYGFMHIPTKAEHIDAANQAFPDAPYEHAKAWPEMVHRYLAGILGLLVLALAVLSWINREKFSVKHSSFLLALVTFQAALGMWTVTIKLHPSIVMLHLMGGFATFSLMAALALRYQHQHLPFKNLSGLVPLKKLVIGVFVVLLLQVALGGWTSANYAAMVCVELPICQGQWLNTSDFYNGFQFWGRQADTYEFGILEQDARIAIHVSHRIGAIITTLAISYLIVRLFRMGQQSIAAKNFAILLSALLVTQVTLGVNNILMQLPLANAVAHNAVGALLVVTMTCLLTLILISQKSQQKVS
jgi:cytochrome c oxidase assembly protein subunit 15